MDKFQIFYKINSMNNISFSISRIDLQTDTYKLKIIYESFDKNTFSTKKYKIKEVHLGASEVLYEIENIPFDKYKENDIDLLDESYVQISYGMRKITSKNILDFENILDDFGFLDILKIQVEEYDKIKNVYEYVKLRDLYINRRIHTYDSKKILEELKENNPYDLFEDISYLKAIS